MTVITSESPSTKRIIIKVMQTPAHIIDRITKELSQLTTMSFDDDKVLGRIIHVVTSILDMAQNQGEISYHNNLTAEFSTTEKNVIVVMSDIDTSTFSWKVIKKVTPQVNAQDAYDRAMKGM